MKRLLSVSAMAGIAGRIDYSGDDGPAKAASLNDPSCLALDNKGNIYFADRNNNVIRMVTRRTGIITTVAGDGTQGYSGDNGPATAAHLNNPVGVAIDTVGNIYIADALNHVIRKVTRATGIITRVAGIYGKQGYTGDGGPATSARLSDPLGVAVDLDGNIYIADKGNNIIRRVDTSTRIITTVAGIAGKQGEYSGDGLAATLALLNTSTSVAVNNAENILTADSANSAIRMITGSTGIIRISSEYVSCILNSKRSGCIQQS